MDALPLVVPVRFAGGGLSMQTTTSKVGLASVFIRCMVAPKPGAPLKIELTLPDAVAPVELTGTCGERVSPGDRTKEAGFWAKLDPLSEFANTSLCAALGLPPPAKAAARA